MKEPSIKISDCELRTKLLKPNPVPEPVTRNLAFGGNACRLNPSFT